MLWWLKRRQSLELGNSSPVGRSAKPGRGARTRVAQRVDVHGFVGLAPGALGIFRTNRSLTHNQLTRAGVPVKLSVFGKLVEDDGCRSVQNECLSGPWSDAGNPVDGDVSDVAGLSDFRRWKLDIRSEISVSQMLQQGRGASFGDTRPPVNDQILN